jgi:Secretion system C-terminal sorting domain
MSYLCGMKKAIATLILLMLETMSFPLNGTAQVAMVSFSPNGIIFSDSVESTLTFTTTMDCYFVSGGVVHLKCTPRNITAYPSEVTGIAGQKLTEKVTVIAHLDSTPGCWFHADHGLNAVDDSGNFLYGFFIAGGYIYSPQIIGLIHLLTDTLNFGHVPVGADTSLSINVQADTFGSIFRELQSLNVLTPFSSSDSITPDFGCGAIYSRANYFDFHPTAIGNYIDTVFLYDPIRKDSTMLILLGEGVAAGVSPNAAEDNSFRIYPNPCDRSAAISLSGEDIEEVTVQNILGERVFESRQEPSQFLNLNTSTLPSGIYFVEVRSGQGQYRQRIIISH